MERRKFFSKAALTIPVVVAPGVYGTPAAARDALFSAAPRDGLLQAPLNRMNVPESLQPDVLALGHLGARLMDDGQFAARFSSNPKIALEELGIGGAIDASDPVIEVFRAIGDPKLKTAMQTSDYKAFVREMKRRGILAISPKSALKERFRQLYMADYEKFNRSMGQVLAARPDLAELLQKDDKLHALVASFDGSSVKDMSRNPFSNQVSAKSYIDPEAVPLVAVSWVAVAVMVLVGAMAWVVYVVEVKTEVGTSPPPPPPPPGANFKPQTAMEPDRSTAAASAFESRQKVAAIVGSQAAGDLRRAAAVAALLGRPDLAVETTRWVIDAHIDAVVGTLIELNDLKVEPTKIREFKRRMTSLVRSAAGV